MGVFWDLGLNAGNESDAGKIKAYAKELNNEYKFPMADECKWGGLCFCDLGVNYGTTRPDNAQKFEELVEKVVAHFPEMKLHFYVTGDGAEYQWDKISKNGLLVDYEPWCMNIHCDGEYFKELLSYIDYIALQGFEVSHNEAECSFDWKYDRISEEDKCNSVLQHISKQLPQVELICYKNEWKDGVPEISEYCIMMNGDGEWKEADDTMIDLAEKCVYGILEDKTTIFDIIKDAGACFAQILEEVRKDYRYYYLIETIMSNTESPIYFMKYFKPEDKEWLMQEDECYITIFNAILLWGKFYRFHTWKEKFVDEDTEEEVMITRTEISNTPLFDMNADEDKKLFERLYNHDYSKCCDNRNRNIIELLEYTDIDYTIILHKMLDGREYSVTHGDIDDEIKWMCEKLGDIYRWGCERFGRFIDKQKAKKYYEIAQITDDNPLDDEKQYVEYVETPTSFKYTIKGDAGELKAMIERHATMSLDNEFGFYAPIQEIMHKLVGTEPNQPKYLGNVLYISEENGNLIVEGEANEPDMLGYAILKKYPTLKISVEE